MNYYRNWAREVIASIEQENNSEIEQELEQDIEQTIAQVSDQSNAVVFGDDNEFEDDVVIVPVNLSFQEAEQEAEQEGEQEAEVEQENDNDGDAVATGDDFTNLDVFFI